MPGAKSCDPAGPDFAAFGGKASQHIDVFVVDFGVFFSAKLADFAGAEITPEAPASARRAAGTASSKFAGF